MAVHFNRDWILEFEIHKIRRIEHIGDCKQSKMSVNNDLNRFKPDESGSEGKSTSSCSNFILLRTIWNWDGQQTSD